MSEAKNNEGVRVQQDALVDKKTGKVYVERAIAVTDSGKLASTLPDFRNGELGYTVRLPKSKTSER